MHEHVRARTQTSYSACVRLPLSALTFIHARHAWSSPHCENADLVHLVHSAITIVPIYPAKRASLIPCSSPRLNPYRIRVSL
ncbi:hypothetical protein OG21DRAFT_1508638 [Imleria badia]|nr:hypothetical protein OG21DRAFT_1508638 [Imleria badia]